MNELTKEKTMTVKEISEVMGVSARVVQMQVKKLFPEIVENGKPTRLNEKQVTRLKLELQSHHNLEGTFELVQTDLEMELLAKKVELWREQKIKDLQEELEIQNNRINMLIHDNKTYTTTEIAKELNLKSANELNKLLANKNIQYKVNNTWVLSASYSDCGYESIKQQELDSGKIIYNRHWTGKGRDFILQTIGG